MLVQRLRSTNQSKLFKKGQLDPIKVKKEIVRKRERVIEEREGDRSEKERWMDRYIDIQNERGRKRDRDRD